ncbi:MAG: ASCH domain-containing protein [Acidobacteria bacterium]|nr:ASCH domain-containing protein [Acidobacteriota bacterium]
MKALTIRQPWAYAILHLGKDVENRSWRTNHRGPLLIHAAAYHERHPREALAENMPRPPSDESLTNIPEGSIVGIVDVVGCVKNSKSRWAQKGSWHWVIENPRPIRPIECKGRLGLWTPPPAVMKKLPAWVKKMDLR